MEKKKLYVPTQLVVALDAKVLKVYMWILSWSASEGEVKYYSKQFAKACKMEQDEVERCIQSLIDTNLVTVRKDGNIWMIIPSVDVNQKYYQIPISKVLEGNGIPISESVTWNIEQEPLVSTTSNKIDGMTHEQMKKMLHELQIRIKEHEEVEKMIKTASGAMNTPKVDDLPF